MIASKGIDTGKFYYNNLYRDYIFNFENLDNFYGYDYRDIESYRKRILDIKKDYDGEKRLKIYKILKKYNESTGCGPATIKNLEKLKREDSAVIIGGQQPGFLGGPLFILYKIFTILRLSTFLEKKLRIPVVPCFWNASDDSSSGQIDNINILIGNRIKNIKLDLSGIRKKTRYSDIYFPGERLDRVIAELEKILRPTDFKPDVLNFYKRGIANAKKYCSPDGSCRDGKVNISGFFSILVTEMFRECGIVIVEPSVAELKKSGDGLLEFDADNYMEINHLINQTGKKLAENGYHSQLNYAGAALNSFYCVGGIRHKIYPDEDNKNLFKIAGKKYSKGELINIFTDNPSCISQNVVLRPLFQDNQLPVLCSICGPGETSYMAQLKQVYELSSIKMPVIYPRFSATIIEKKVKKVLAKLKITEEELELTPEEIIKNKISKEIRADIPELTGNTEKDVLERLNVLEGTLKDSGMNISSSFDRIKRNMKKEIMVLERKIYSELKKQDGVISESISKAYANIFPGDNLQEREINIITYLNKYGFGFIEELYSAVKPFDFTHKFLEVS